MFLEKMFWWLDGSEKYFEKYVLTNNWTSDIRPGARRG